MGQKKGGPKAAFSFKHFNNHLPQRRRGDPSIAFKDHRFDFVNSVSCRRQPVVKAFFLEALSYFAAAAPVVLPVELVEELVEPP